MINSFEELQSIIQNNPKKEIPIIWERDYNMLESIIVPEPMSSFKDGEIKDIGIIGISPYVNIIDAGFFTSIYKGIEQTINWTKYIMSSFWALILGNISLDQLSGPLHIAKIAGDTAQSGGLYSLIMLMAIISINLGLINILPLPVVDGGHVAIAIVEAIYGKELPIKLKYSIQLFGFILLMSLFVFIFINDIKNVF